MSEIKETSLLDEVDSAPRATPRKAAKATPRASAPSAVSFNKTAVRNALTSLYEAGAAGLMMYGDLECASVLGDDEFISKAVDSWLVLADSNPFIKKMLARLATTSGWGGVVMAHMPLLMAIASHHTNFGSQLANLANGTPDAREADSFAA